MQAARKGSDTALTMEQEAVLLLQATRMNTLSKLTFNDARRFEELCIDLFPGLKVEDMVHADLEGELDSACEKMKLELIPMQRAKILQFYEAGLQRRATPRN